MVTCQPWLQRSTCHHETRGNNTNSNTLHGVARVITYHCMRVYVPLSSSLEKGRNFKPATADAKLMMTTNTIWELVSGMKRRPMQDTSTRRTFSITS